MNKEKLSQKVKDDYNLIADHFSQTRQGQWPEFSDFKPYLKAGQRVLDIGCGNGRLYFSFLKDLNLEYHGIDFSERLIEIAKEAAHKNHHAVIASDPEYSEGSEAIPKRDCFVAPFTNVTTRNDHQWAASNFKFQVSEITKLPYQDNYFDIVFCIATFHHLPSKELRVKALKEIKRVLKPGGYLLMTNWYWWSKFPWKYFFNNFWQKVSFKDLFIPWKNLQGEIITNLYYHAFTQNELKNLFKKVELKIEKNYLKSIDQRTGKKSKINIVTIGKK